MSALDWVGETKTRFTSDAPSVAVVTSLRELYRGARRRGDWLVYQVLGKRAVRARVAGVSARFHVDGATSVARARSLNRETPVAEWLFEDIGASDVFWDVGAYHGHYSVLAAAQGATAVAFEPHPANHARIAHHRSLNDAAIDIQSVALSNRVDTALIGGVAASEARVNTESGCATRLVRGDDVSAPRPSVVKIDVEGHELEVLAGLRETLMGVRRVAVEVHVDQGVAPGAVTDRLRQAGLRVTELETPRSQVYLGGVRT